MTKKLLYFLCTGNSCRSQMAEGWAKHYLSADWDVKSAGIEAHGINPKAIKAMAEVNIDISDQTSEIIDEATLQQANLVVTLCGDALDRCPTIPSYVTQEHWGFQDPAKATGSQEEILKVFRQVRNQIGEKIKQFSATEIN